MLNRDWLKHDKYGKKYGARYMPETGKRIKIDGQYKTEQDMQTVEVNCPHCNGTVLFGLDGCVEPTWLVFNRCECRDNRVCSIIRVSNPGAVVKSDLWPTEKSRQLWPTL